MKITPREKDETPWGEGEMRDYRKVQAFDPLSPPRLAFLAWGDFHARLRFVRSSVPEEK